MRNTVFFLITCFVFQSSSMGDDGQILNLEDFNASKSGMFPGSWQTGEDRGKELYIIAEEPGSANKFLTVTDRGESVQIGKKVSWDIQKYPILRWTWRIKKLPEGAAENLEATNDSAAGIYVVFDRAWFILPRTIKYVWSSTLKVGTVVEKGYTRIIVLRSGKKGMNTWVTETVNISEDYRRFFGKDPVDPQGIALLTDANATGSIAVADYDNFSAISGASKRIIAGKLEDR